MDLDELSGWIVGLNAVSLCLRVLRTPGTPLRLLLPTALSLAAGGLGLLLFPERAGTLALGVFVVLHLLPALALRRASRLGARHDSVAAARWTWLALPLLGAREVRAQRRLLLALDELERDREAGLRTLADIAQGSGPTAAQAEQVRCSASLDWSGALERLERDPEFAGRLRRDPSAASLILRAEAELEGPQVFLRRYAAFKESPSYRRNAAYRVYLDLEVMSQTGQIDAVEALLAGPLDAWPEGTKDAVRAQTLVRAGRLDAARALDERLVEAGPPLVRPGARRRLESPGRIFDASAVPEPLIEPVRARAEELRSLPRARAPRRPWVSYGIAAVLAVVHAASYLFSGSRGAQLYALGALGVGGDGPPLSSLELLTRAFAANYLHLGAAHFVLDTLGLLVIGTRVEAEAGPRKTLAVFALGGPLALATAAILVYAQRTEPTLLVGASGGLMALIGALLVLHLGHLRSGRSPERRRLALSVLTIVALQSVFDAGHPQVSMSAHLAGVVWGIALAWSLGLARRPSSRQT